MGDVTRWVRPLAIAVAVVGLAGVLALATGAADDDEVGSGVPSDEAYAGALTAYLLREPDGLPVTGDEARCMAEAVVDEIGNERLAGFGVVPTDFDGDGSFADVVGPGNVELDEAGLVVDRWAACTDLDALALRVMVPEGAATEAQRACLGEQLLGGDFVRTSFELAFVASIEDPLPPELEATAQAAIAACFSPG